MQGDNPKSGSKYVIGLQLSNNSSMYIIADVEVRLTPCQLEGLALPCAVERDVESTTSALIITRLRF